MVGGTAPHGRPQVTHEGNVARAGENAGERGPGGKEKKWTDCVAKNRRMFGTTKDWSTAALDPGAWYNTVCEGVRRFIAAWVREEKKASVTRQRKR